MGHQESKAAHPMLEPNILIQANAKVNIRSGRLRVASSPRPAGEAVIVEAVVPTAFLFTGP
jgi:hypothetical protein